MSARLFMLSRRSAGASLNSHANQTGSQYLNISKNTYLSLMNSSYLLSMLWGCYVPSDSHVLDVSTQIYIVSPYLFFYISFYNVHWPIALVFQTLKPSGLTCPCARARFARHL